MILCLGATRSVVYKHTRHSLCRHQSYWVSRRSEMRTIDRTGTMGMVSVLVVDDDRELRAMLRMTLEDAGYVVLEAAHGMEALSVLRDRIEPLIVVLDNRMPHLGGSYLLQLVSVDEGLLRHHRYILIAGDKEAFSRAVAPLRERLDARVLGKPFDLDEFSRAVAQAATELAHLSTPRPPSASFEV